MQLKLYTTSNCHLCEQAELLITKRVKIDDITLIEIADDATLLEKYGTRIPVLQRIDDLSELDWPFNDTELIKFINQ